MFLRGSCQSLKYPQSSAEELQGLGNPEEEAFSSSRKEVITPMPSQEPPWWQGPKARGHRRGRTSSRGAAVLPPTGAQAPGAGEQPGQVVGKRRGAWRGRCGPRARRGGWPGAAQTGLEVRSWPSRQTPDSWGADLQPRARGTRPSERHERLRDGSVAGKGTWGLSRHLGRMFRGEVGERAAVLALRRAGRRALCPGAPEVPAARPPRPRPASPPLAGGAETRARGGGRRRGGGGAGPTLERPRDGWRGRGAAGRGAARGGGAPGARGRGGPSRRLAAPAGGARLPFLRSAIDLLLSFQTLLPGRG